MDVDEQIDNLVKGLKKIGINAWLATDKETEYSEKTREESK